MAIGVVTAGCCCWRLIPVVVIAVVVSAADNGDDGGGGAVSSRGMNQKFAMRFLLRNSDFVGMMCVSLEARGGGGDSEPAHVYCSDFFFFTCLYMNFFFTTHTSISCCQHSYLTPSDLYDRLYEYRSLQLLTNDRYYRADNSDFYEIRIPMNQDLKHKRNFWKKIEHTTHSILPSIGCKKRHEPCYENSRGLVLLAVPTTHVMQLYTHLKKKKIR